ncbi:6849_t:CDS:2 [Entrophospora sp. SA101]|nr:6849_t:CDS:2 [Entrophospora sp. SA101]
MSNSSSLKVLSTSAGVDLNNISNWLHLVHKYNESSSILWTHFSGSAGIKKDFVLVSDFDIEKSVHNNLGKVGAVLVAFMDEVESSQSLNIINQYFDDLIILKDQDVLKDENCWNKVLACIPNMEIRNTLNEH